MKLSPPNAPRMEYRSGPTVDNEPKTVAELQEIRSNAVNRMKQIESKANSENRQALTADEQKEFDLLESEARTAAQSIERRKKIDEHDRSSAPAITQYGGRDGTFEERARNFSITKAMANILEPGSVDAGSESELSTELATRTGKTPQGILVPHESFQEKRALLTSGDGAALYPTRHRDDLYIDRLRDQLLVGRLGATILSGLTGKQEIPKLTDSVIPYWVDEHKNVTPSETKFGKVDLEPKTVGSETEYSRRMILNASPDVERLIRNDLSTVIASAIDMAAISGDGTGPIPTGILHQADTNKTPLDAANGDAFSELLEFSALLATENALNGNLAWLTSPKAYKVLRLLQRSPETPLMTIPNFLIDYPILQSTHVPSLLGEGDDETPVILGNWSDLIVGYWSGVDILLNPFHADVYSRGGVKINALQDVDVAVRHPESFVISEGFKV